MHASTTIKQQQKMQRSNNSCFNPIFYILYVYVCFFSCVKLGYFLCYDQSPIKYAILRQNNICYISTFVEILSIYTFIAGILDVALTLNGTFCLRYVSFLKYHVYIFDVVSK